ncbi:SMP-30/gluconolactonase/LRE family protein [Streptomyces tailanensis]|uniref:SMP-30/gluconolactonase/LRE family protein n=1 Tax=Streptomyces tailanensis TaxID=2569858 RepID=UPI001FE682C2|nr:SMP-30/gluconolactonase/LRE family protein [Streptomyces tailanensis]
MTACPSRFDETGERRPTSDRWTARRLNRPNRLWGSNGIAFGPDGRLYVAEYLAGRISAFDLVTRDVDVVVPMDSPVQSPDDLAFGADGSMYIADLVPGRVWRRSPRGEYSVVSDDVENPNGITCIGDRLFINEMKFDGRLMELFPDGGDPVVLTEGLALGNAMQRGPDGYLYYPHMITGQVWRIPPDGGTPEVVAEEVHMPVAVRFDQGGVLHVLSLGVEGYVTRIDLHGSGSRTLVTSGLKGLDNAAFDAENRMFVSSYASGGLTELHPDGRTRELVPRGFDGPYGVTVDLGGTVHAADHYRLAGPAVTDEGEGELLGAFGKAEPGGVTTRLLRPFAHGITADGELLHYTSQFGTVHTYEPTTGTTRDRAGGLDRPIGIAVGRDGSLVVAEAGAGRIVAIDAEDTVTVLAEGFDRPTDVAFDAEGRRYRTLAHCSTLQAGGVGHPAGSDPEGHSGMAKIALSDNGVVGPTAGRAGSQACGGCVRPTLTGRQWPVKQEPVVVPRSGTDRNLLPSGRRGRQVSEERLGSVLRIDEAGRAVVAPSSYRPTARAPCCD